MPLLKFNADTHQYLIGKEIYPSVSKILTELGIGDFSFVRKDVLSRAQQFGIALHKACELEDKGNLDLNSVSEPLLPYLVSWKRFKQDYDIVFTSKQIEQPVYSARWKFAGMPDRNPVVINKKLTLLDIKSTSSLGKNARTGLQLAAYQIIWEEMMGWKIQQRWSVQLTPNGYNIEKYSDSRDKLVFLAALTLYKWRKENGYGT